MPCAVLCCAMLQVRLFNQTLSLTLCNPMDLSPPDSSVHGILQARILEWVVMPSSKGSSQSKNETHISWVFCTAGRFCTAEPPGKSHESWFSSVQFTRSVVSDSLQPHESQHARPPCPSPSPGVHSDSCPSSL